MEITLRLIAVEFPGETAPNGVRVLEIDEQASLQQALDSSGIPNAQSYMTLINDEAVSIADRPARILNNGDTITIFPPIKGG